MLADGLDDDVFTGYTAKGHAVVLFVTTVNTPITTKLGVRAVVISGKKMAGGENKMRVILLVLMAIISLRPVHASVFYPLRFDSAADRSLTEFYVSPPTGLVTLGGVKFDIPGDRLNCFISDPNRGGTRCQITARVPKPQTAYLLLTGTSVHADKRGVLTGHLYFHYADGTMDTRDLVVGDTICDWVMVPGVVTDTSSPDVTRVWHGPSQAGWGYSDAFFNMLTVSLRQDGVLTGITLDAVNPTTGLFLSGVTVVGLPISVGAARALQSGSFVHIEGAIVTASQLDSNVAFVESNDRSAGIKLFTNQTLTLGQIVNFAGIVGRQNGEYQISDVSFTDISFGTPLAPVLVTSKTIGNDPTQFLVMRRFNVHVA